MSQTTLSAAVRFGGVFRRHLRLVATLEPSDSDILIHRKLVLMSILDALGRAVFPGERNRDRFVRIVTEFATWPESSRISLPHLARLLEHDADPMLEQLRTYTERSLSQWIPGHVIPLSEDPEPDQLLRLLAPGSSLATQVKGLQLRRIQHSQLFYSYRNSLVHELRPPGHELHLWDVPDPTYVHLTLLSKATVWQLQYSIPFLARIAAECIDAVQAYLVEHDINAFEVLDSGEYWLSELNR